MLQQKILKGILMLRVFNRYQSKEEQIAELYDWYQKGYLTENQIDDWIDSLREDMHKTPEQLEEESRIVCEEMAERELEWALKEQKEHYSPSATARDYGPSNPWDAPGMSIRDFI